MPFPDLSFSEIEAVYYTLHLFITKINFEYEQFFY